MAAPMTGGFSFVGNGDPGQVVQTGGPSTAGEDQAPPGSQGTPQGPPPPETLTPTDVLTEDDIFFRDDGLGGRIIIPTHDGPIVLQIADVLREIPRLEPLSELMEAQLAGPEAAGTGGSFLGVSTMTLLIVGVLIVIAVGAFFFLSQ